MEVNLPVWSYYTPGFVDPLYQPYQTHDISTPDGVCKVNTWKQQGYANGFVNPDLVRKGWGLDFQLQHPDTDSCPQGWVKHISPDGTQTGWCVSSKPDYGEYGLYSKYAFVPKYQYFSGYTIPNNTDQNEVNEFDRKSVSPFTGNYISTKSYQQSMTRSQDQRFRQKHQKLPSQYSLI